MRLLHNYLALGQWEMASLAMRQLCRADEQQRTLVFTVLRHLIEHGPQPDWCAPPAPRWSWPLAGPANGRAAAWLARPNERFQADVQERPLGRTPAVAGRRGVPLPC